MRCIDSTNPFWYGLELNLGLLYLVGSCIAKTKFIKLVLRIKRLIPIIEPRVAPRVALRGMKMIISMLLVFDEINPVLIAFKFMIAIQSPECTPVAQLNFIK